MFGALASLFKKTDDSSLQDRFMQRFTGRTIIVHDGLSIGWVGELHKEGGGGGHFRIDVRNPPGTPPSPIEWVVHRWILPQHLPLPLLVKVEPEQLLIRHLTRNDKPVHPSEINWMLGEMPERVHLVLRPSGPGFLPERKLPVSDNHVEFDI